MRLTGHCWHTKSNNSNVEKLSSNPPILTSLARDVRRRFHVEPHDVIIVEGIMALYDKELRDQIGFENLCRYV